MFGRYVCIFGWCIHTDGHWQSYGAGPQKVLRAGVPPRKEDATGRRVDNCGLSRSGSDLIGVSVGSAAAGA